MLAAWSTGGLADVAPQSASHASAGKTAKATKTAETTQAAETTRTAETTQAAETTPAAEATKTAKTALPAKRTLDLSVPPINHIMSPEQVQALVADQDDENAPPPEDVTVERPHYMAPIPGGVAAIPWALLHPLQAWRIIAPITDD